MPEHTPAPTADDTIAVWLAHPEGAPLVRSLFADAPDPDAALAQVRQLPLATLVQLSDGRLPQDRINAMVRQLHGGMVPERTSAAAPAATARFGGQTVIVTGAASGIGRAVTERVLAEVGRVVAVDVSADRLTALSSLRGEAVVPVAGDITSPGDVARILDATGGDVQALANVAGIMDGMLPLHETGDDVWARVMAVNVTGTFQLMKAVLPTMLEAGSGSIVNVASEAALRGNAAGSAYTASKHAVVGLTRSAAFLYGPQGIRVNAVAPGPTATAISGEFRSDFSRGRLMPFLAAIPPVVTADTMANPIAWLLSDESVNVNGQVLASDGGWSVQ